MTALADIKLPANINYSAISRDGKRMACVGDGTDRIYFCDLDGDQCTPAPHRDICSLRPGGKSHRSSMSVAWSTDNEYVATGSEDGLFALFRYKNDDEKESRVYYTMCDGACRAVKFSPVANIHVVAVASTFQCEANETPVFVLDYRTLERQDLRCPGELSGITFTPDGQVLYVGTDKGIYEFPLRVGLTSLKDAVIYYVKKRRSQWSHFGWDMDILPLELKEKVLL